MIHPFQHKKIVVGVTGGIAAYKAIVLVRSLMMLGAQVRVVMTECALEFVGPLTFQALSGFPVVVKGFSHEVKDGMDHIALARWAEYVVIAPITANTMAKCVAGFADDALSTLMLATKAPIFVCPGMNQQMWRHPATQANYQVLQARGVQFIGPDEGLQACGDVGPGRMSEVETIIAALRCAMTSPVLRGTSVIITAGPTREAIDPVRFISNRSSGKMGYALAAAAHWAGAEVTLISGPVALSVPQGIRCQSVETASEMYEVVMQEIQTAHQPSLFIAAAAVADFSCHEVQRQKIKKEQIADAFAFSLHRTQDILLAVSQSQLVNYVVGFAAETEQVLVHAKRKLISKKLDMIIANEVGNGLGFDQDEQSVWWVTKDHERFLPYQKKEDLAVQLIDEIALKMRENCREAINSN